MHRGAADTETCVLAPPHGVVETQVDDERSDGVEEGKDAQGHEELSGGREVSHEVHGLGGGFIVTEGHLILDPVQPAGGMKPTLPKEPPGIIMALPGFYPRLLFLGGESGRALQA